MAEAQRSARQFTMRSPLFGPCRLVPHSIDEEPDGPIGYVQFEDDPNNLGVAIYRDGAWHDRKLRKISRPIVTWYSVVKADGSTVF